MEQSDVIFNTIHANPKHIFNVIVLIIKQFIYQCKCQGEIPNLRRAIQELIMVYYIEIHNSYKVGNTHKIKCKWNPVYSVEEQFNLFEKG